MAEVRQFTASHPPPGMASTVAVTVKRQVCLIYMLMLTCLDVSSHTFLMHCIR